MPDGENQIRSNEQIAFATIGIVAHATRRKHPDSHECLSIAKKTAYAAF